MNVAVIDNYDSFTYNLVHYIEPNVNSIKVYRNDEDILNELGKFDAIVISPGPGIPKDAGISLEVVEKYYKTKKILGICLGHQAIAMTFGAKLRNLNQVLHGISLDSIKSPESKIFHNLPNTFKCGRYHSWVIDEKTLDKDFEVTARDEAGNIMAISHRKFDIHGMQFHPESILTDYGMKMILNWLK